jgi:hypothetical protein
MSFLSPSGKSSQAGPAADLTGGSSNRWDGQPSIVPAQKFQALAMARRAASFADKDVVSARYRMNRLIPHSPDDALILATRAAIQI